MFQVKKKFNENKALLLKKNSSSKFNNNNNNIVVEEFNGNRRMSTHILLDSCRKIYIERDYSIGTGVAFNREMPIQLEGFIDCRIYEETMSSINALFAEVEEVCFGSMLETVISCGTCYINRFFVPTRYEKQLVKIRQYIDDRNKSVLIPLGICITDPMERGLRVLEISLLSTGKETQVITQFSQPSRIEEV